MINNYVSTQFLYSSTFSRVTWHLHRFFSNSPPPQLQWTPQLTITYRHISLILALSTRCFFREYQDTAVGCELTIRTIVPPGISTKPYRKTTIVIPFFRHIISLSSSPSVTMSDLTATVAAYLRHTNQFSWTCSGTHRELGSSRFLWHR